MATNVAEWKLNFGTELHYPVVNGIRVARFSRLKGTQMSERVLNEYRYEEAVNQLVNLVTWFKKRPKDQRRDHHRKSPTFPIPWKQQPVDSSRFQNGQNGPCK